MNLNKIKKNKGFTIVEAIIAVFILSISISAMLGLTASSINSARYANNEISANYLLQEAIDSIRNSRDTIVFQKGDDWSTFVGKYNNCWNPSSQGGCSISTDSFDPENPDTCKIYAGNDTCSSNVMVNGEASKFKRQVKMVQKTDELEVTVEVEYPYGTTTKTRSLKMNLLNWQID